MITPQNEKLAIKYLDQAQQDIKDLVNQKNQFLIFGLGVQATINALSSLNILQGKLRLPSYSLHEMITITSNSFPQFNKFYNFAEKIEFIQKLPLINETKLDFKQHLNNFKEIINLCQILLNQELLKRNQV